MPLDISRPANASGSTGYRPSGTLQAVPRHEPTGIIIAAPPTPLLSFFLSFVFFLLFLESSRHGGLKINPIVEKKFSPRDAFPFEIGRKVKAASIEASIRAKEFRGG